MTRYAVTFNRAQWAHWEVEADDETAAMAKAYNRLTNGEVAWDKANTPKVSLLDLSTREELDGLDRRV